MKKPIAFFLMAFSFNVFADFDRYKTEENLIKHNKFRCEEKFIEMRPFMGDRMRNLVGVSLGFDSRENYQSISCQRWIKDSKLVFSVIDQIERFHDYYQLYNILSDYSSDKTLERIIKNLNAKRGNYNEIKIQISKTFTAINYLKVGYVNVEHLLQQWPRGYENEPLATQHLANTIASLEEKHFKSLKDELKKLSSLLNFQSIQFIIEKSFSSDQTEQAIFWIQQYHEPFYGNGLSKNETINYLKKANINLTDHPALKQKLMDLNFNHDQLSKITKEVSVQKVEEAKIEVKVEAPVETPKIKVTKAINASNLQWKGLEINIDKSKATTMQKEVIEALNNASTSNEKMNLLIKASLRREAQLRQSSQTTKDQIKTSLSDFSKKSTAGLIDKLQKAKIQMDEQLKNNPYSYNRDATAVVDIFTQQKMQCSSGTDYLLMHALYNHSSQEDKQIAVVVLRPQHVLPGIWDSQTPTIINGVEAVVEGSAKLTIQSADGQWPKDTRVVLADDYWMTRLFENVFVDKKEVLAQILKNSEEKLKIKQGNITEADSKNSNSGQSFGDALNSTSLGFGSANIPSGNQARAQMDNVPQSMDSGALVEAGKERTAKKIDGSPFDRFAGAVLTDTLVVAESAPKYLIGHAFDQKVNHVLNTCGFYFNSNLSQYIEHSVPYTLSLRMMTLHRIKIEDIFILERSYSSSDVVQITSLTVVRNSNTCSEKIRQESLKTISHRSIIHKESAKGKAILLIKLKDLETSPETEHYLEIQAQSNKANWYTGQK